MVDGATWMVALRACSFEANGRRRRWQRAVDHGCVTTAALGAFAAEKRSDDVEVRRGEAMAGGAPGGEGQIDRCGSQRRKPGASTAPTTTRTLAASAVLLARKQRVVLLRAGR